VSVSSLSGGTPPVTVPVISEPPPAGIVDGSATMRATRASGLGQSFLVSASAIVCTTAFSLIWITGDGSPGPQT